ncbi:MAG: heme-binding beta-barrel domain-containing protein [Candidatus Promineifilaceae bacterium]
MPVDSQNRLKTLAFLIGDWTGAGEGFGHTSQVEHAYRFVLQQHFIQGKTKSVARDDDGNVIEVHEDLGMFSYDPDRKAIVLREFHSEGYVNVYVMEEVKEFAKQLVFTSEKTEGAGGLLARLRYDVLSADTYMVALDLAKPGEDFRECQVVTMKRVP